MSNQPSTTGPGITVPVSQIVDQLKVSSLGNSLSGAILDVLTHPESSAGPAEEIAARLREATILQNSQDSAIRTVLKEYPGVPLLCLMGAAGSAFSNFHVGSTLRAIEAGLMPPEQRFPSHADRAQFLTRLTQELQDGLARSWRAMEKSDVSQSPRQTLYLLQGLFEEINDRHFPFVKPYDPKDDFTTQLLRSSGEPRKTALYIEEAQRADLARPVRNEANGRFILAVLRELEKTVSALDAQNDLYPADKALISSTLGQFKKWWDEVRQVRGFFDKKTQRSLFSDIDSTLTQAAKLTA